MYGQSYSAYKLLARAYGAILRRMGIANAVCTVVIAGASILTARAHDDASEADGDGDTPVTAAAFSTPGPDGTYAYTHPVDANGVFAGAVTTDQRIGTQSGVIIYFRDPTDPEMHSAPSNYGTSYNMMLQAVDKYRSYVAAMSGGLMDIKYTIVDLPVTPQPGGAVWGRDAAAAALLPSVGDSISNYTYATAYYSPNLSTTVMDQPSGTGTVGGGAYRVWSNIGSDDISPSYILHEMGHNLGFNHAPGYELNSGAPGYAYDFATGTYSAVPVTTTSSLSLPASPSLASFPIGGMRQREYGAAFDVMAVNGSLDPRQKQSAGWLDASHFANINATVAPNTSGTIRLYDDMADMTVVTRGSGADLQYGVARGYQAVNYDAFLTRQGYAWHITSAGPVPTGEWVPYVQTFDFYYRAAGILYPGQDTVLHPSVPNAVVVNLNGAYLGYLTKGQTFLEKYVDSSLFIPLRTQAVGGTINLDDNTIVMGAPADLLAYNNGHPGAPLNPDRQRSVWYQVTYDADGVDATGHWADLVVQAFSGAEVYGWRWDAVSGTAGSQDGSGTWTAGAGNNWRSISMALDNQNWTQLEDATFGSGSGAAGVVTLAGPVSVNSLTFNQPGSGQYTLTGSTLSIDIGGIMATASATIDSNVALLNTQFWSVDAGKTLAVNGAITPGTGNILYKNGQGLLALGGASTWTSDLRVVEGPVTQNASQTFSTNADLCIREGASYQILSGTLTLGSGSVIGALPRDSLTATRNVQVGTLRLSSVTGSTAAPEIVFTNGGSIATNVLLDAGTHYLAVNAGTTTISGEISGSGDLDKSGAGGLTLAGNHTFTGDLRIERGLVAMAADSSLSGANTLTFATQASQTAEFRLNGRNTGVTALSSSGAGSASVTNNSASAATLSIAQATNTTYSGTIANGSTGALALVKTGAGTLSLTGNNTYTGGTTIGGGTVRIGGGGALGTGAVTLSGGALSIDQRQGLTQSSIAGAALNTTDAGTGARYTSNFSAITGQSSPNNTNQVFTGKIFLTAGQWSFGESYDDSAYLKINGQVVLNNSTWFTPTYGSITIGATGWYDIDLRVAKDSGGAIADTEGSWLNTQGIGVRQGAVTNQAADYTTFGAGAAGIRLRDLNYVANALVLTADSTVEILDQDSILAESVFTGGITGGGGFTKTGSGTMTLSGTANTYSGVTNVAAGTLAANVAGAFSANSAVVLSNATGVALDLRGFDQTVASLAGGGASGGNVSLGAGTLTAGRDNTSTAFAGVISGSGGFTKAGSGTMTLSGQNTYTGTTKITGGGVLALDYSTGAATSGIVAAASALVLDNGSVRVTGRSGATITQTFAGLTVGDGVNSVTLVRNGATDLVVNLGAISRTGAGTLDFSGLTGSAAGARVVTTSGTTGALLDGGSQWATYNGGDWASRDASGNIVAYSGYADVPTNAGVFPTVSTSNVRIVEAAGTGATTLAAGATTTVNSLLMAATTTAATVDTTSKTLAVAGVSVAANAKKLTIGLTPDAGRLTSATNALQLISNAASATNGLVVNSTIADNGGTPLSVSVSGGVNGGTTVFAGTNTYTGATTVTNNGVLRIGAGGAKGQLGGTAVTVNAGSTLVFDRDTTTSLVVAQAIGGAGKVIQAGTGTTVLNATNTYTGATTVNQGVLQIGSGTNGALGDTVVGVASGATLAFGRTDTTTFANTVTGSGIISRAATGTTVLTGDVAGDSATIAATGTLQVGNGGTTGSLAVATIANAGTLTVNRSDTVTIAAVISGTGTLNQTGTGTTILTANNSYGATVINAGTIQVGNGGTTGSLGSGVLTNSGTLVYDRSDNLTLSSSMSGSGQFVQAGTNILTLTGNNTYSGATTVAAGTLRVGNAGTTGSIGTGALILGSAGALDINRTDTYVLSNAVSGYGLLTYSGTGTLSVTGDGSAHYGNTTVNSGTLSVDGAGSLGNGVLTSNGAAIVFNSSATQLIGTLAGTGTFTLDGSGRVDLGTYTFTGAANINAGTLALNGAGPGLSTINVNAGGTLIVSANLTSTANQKTLVVTGAGVNATTGLYIEDSSVLAVEKGLTLTGAATTIRHTGTGRGNIGSTSGTDIVVQASASGSVIDSNIDIGGTTQYSNTFGINLNVTAGANTATGDLRVDGDFRYSNNGDNIIVKGTGSVNFTGASDLYTGGRLTVQNTAKMMFTGAASIGGGVNSGAISIANGATFVWGSSATQTLSGVISGAGGIFVKNGSGLLTLTGANTRTGALSVNGGTLLLNNTNAMNAGAVSVGIGGRLGGTGSYTTTGATSVAGTLMGGDGTVGSTLTINGSAVTLASESIIRLALGASGTHSTLALASGATLAFSGTQRFLFEDLGLQTGTYQNLITGVAASGTTTGWRIDNAGIAGNFVFDGAGNIDLVVTAVPEPEAYGLMGAGALLGAALIRRRRKVA